jgi:hypothetical protein
MSKKELLIRELEQIPEGLVDEISNYVHYLLVKDKYKQDHAAQKIDLSKTAWAKNWETPDEDEAWKDL